MIKKYTILLAILLLVIITGHSQASIDWIDLPLATLRHQAQEKNKLYIVYLHADWCLPCKWMEENSFRAPKVTHYANQNYLSLQLDINDKQGKYYQKKWKADVLPTLIIFSPQGLELSRKETSMDANQLFDFLRKTNKTWSASQSEKAIVSNTAIMDSPKPTLVVSRPALQPNIAKKEKLVPTHTATKPPVFTPRSGQQYTVLLGTFDEYQQALEMVQKYDNKYGHPVNMIAETSNKKYKYRIISGQFALRSEAGKYLNYLNRNDIMGQIIKE